MGSSRARERGLENQSLWEQAKPNTEGVKGSTSGRALGPTRVERGVERGGCLCPPIMDHIVGVAFGFTNYYNCTRIIQEI